MKADLEVKFPCGYKYKLNISSGIFDFGSIEDDMPKECPLHGKNCPPK